eukprot:CAMPEP_0178903874 /NCGR_PEP_ID=MMETSP0786-20121207/5391_1 /TAXON_ID=186022 /ORGANISM="Thalassionema frauenfeldii, Strain CCMP 1798" /LENGTH=315 /DNA_ID=CAMNT_0020575277 /DNA_START=170 /DNA_END=1118 /DNA_ORIENTATION=+
MTVSWEESITHTGAPWRISLSQDGSDDNPCLILDHIPHNELSNPSRRIESTYTNYSITIDIPDVSCELCSLHFANPMTDKIGNAGSPNGAGCTDPDGSCFSVYHSCTVPLRILGSTPRDDYICPNENPEDWPTVWRGDGNIDVDTSELNVYRRESGLWDGDWLMDVPERYRQLSGSMCTSHYIIDPSPSPTSNDIIDPSPSPVISGAVGPDLCISGAMTVQLDDETVKEVYDLRVGDVVRVSPENFERVYAFGHHDPKRKAKFIEIQTQEEKSVELSEHHMIFVASGNAVPASSLHVGDLLLNGNAVTKIQNEPA